MAVLSDADRVIARDEYVRDLMADTGMTKPELKAAVDAADTWRDANMVAYNQALPATAQANLSTPQKARLLEFVVRRWFETGAG